MRSIEKVLARRNTDDRESENAEKRFAPRRKELTPGIVYLESSTGSFPCLVRDVSTTGAQLELRLGWDNPFSAGVSLNDRILLVLRTHRIMYHCKIMRRGEKMLGVKFTAAPRMLTAAEAKSSTVAFAKTASAEVQKQKAAAAKGSGKMPRA